MKDKTTIEELPYKIPERITYCILNDVTSMDENQQLNRANEKINTIPRNAFEKLNKVVSPINILDL